jgi:hypothetical protein
MDLSPSPFWINKQKQQTLVFDFSNVSSERCNEDDDDANSEVLIGKHQKFSHFSLNGNMRSSSDYQSTKRRRLPENS